MADTFLSALRDLKGQRLEVGTETGTIQGTLVDVNGTTITLATTETGGYGYGNSELTVIRLEYVGFVRVLN